tara:strand:- start:9874 stop:10071 length:198 start_codon:yes stop_codon:yes gene_type:complete
MKRGEKWIQFKTDIDGWWALTCFAASQNKSVRKVASEHFAAFLEDLKKQFPRSIAEKANSPDNVH